MDGCEVAACVGVCGQRNVGVWERVCICEMEARVGAWGCAGWSVGCVGGATWVWRVCVGVGGATRGGAWCHTCVAACGHALAGACIRATWERVGGATWHKDTGVREVGAGVPVGWVGGATWGRASGRGWAWERGSGATARPNTLTGPACPRSLPLRFWINIIKNPQLVFDVQTSDSVDAVLLVIAQTFVDACTLADHKLGRVSGPGGLGARVGRPGGARTRSGSLGEERREASDRPWGLGEA